MTSVKNLQSLAPSINIVKNAVTKSISYKSTIVYQSSYLYITLACMIFTILKSEFLFWFKMVFNGLLVCWVIHLVIWQLYMILSRKYIRVITHIYHLLFLVVQYVFDRPIMCDRHVLIHITFRKYVLKIFSYILSIHFRFIRKSLGLISWAESFYYRYELEFDRVPCVIIYVYHSGIA